MLLSERNLRCRVRALPFKGMPLPAAASAKDGSGAKVRRKPNDDRELHPVRLPPVVVEIRPTQPDQPGIDPLYLFACGILWRRHSDAGAGWELVKFLRIPGETQQIAAWWLGQKERYPAAA